jgi:hypothetical protein
VTDPGISDAAKAVLAEHVDSVLQLEMLLLLHAQPQREWTAPQIVNELRLDATWTEEQLRNLCTRGILTCTEQPVRTYRYGPSDDALARGIDDLARAYADWRVAVIGLIYSKPMDKIRSFADAFRIRGTSGGKDKPHG